MGPKCPQSLCPSSILVRGLVNHAQPNFGIEDEWFKANRRYVEVFQLPPYWPELNATERIWNYTRKFVTHNRFFERPQDLCDALFRRFDYVRRHPQEIEDLLYPFF